MRDFELHDPSLLVRSVDHSVEVTDFDVLTMLLGDREPAENLLRRYGNLQSIVTAPSGVLEAIEGVGTDGAVKIKALRAGYSNLRGGGLHDKICLNTAEEYAGYMRHLFVLARDEEMYLLSLGKNNVVLDCSFIARGDSCNLIADEGLIFEKVFTTKARSFVLAHNHFISCYPSEFDLNTTAILSAIGKRLNVELKEHLIFCGDNCIAMFKEHLIRDVGFFPTTDDPVTENAIDRYNKFREYIFQHANDLPIRDKMFLGRDTYE